MKEVSLKDETEARTLTQKGGKTGEGAHQRCRHSDWSVGGEGCDGGSCANGTEQPEEELFLICFLFSIKGFILTAAAMYIQVIRCGIHI